MNMVWGMEGVTPTEMLLLLALADRANDDNVCWPGQASLAKKCNTTDRTVRRTLKALENKNLLKITHRQGEGEGRKTNIYTLTLEGQPDNLSGGATGQIGKATGQSVRGGQPDISDRQPDISGRATGHFKGGNRTQVSANTLVNTKEEPKEEPKDKKPDANFPDWLNMISWGEFEQHRKEIKKPLTDLARTKLFQTLSALDHQEQDGCISRSIENCWAGLFPERKSGAKRNGQQPFKTALEKSADRMRAARDPIKAMEF